MKKTLILLILLACTCSLFSVDYTSTQDGAWSSAATWGGGGIPGNGDIANIYHAVTVSGTVTVGESPVTYSGAGSTDPAIYIQLGASLTLADDAILNARGDVNCRGTITMGAGSVLELDASQAAAPSTTVYRLCLETSSSDRLATYLTVNGTSGNHCEIRSNSGGANGRILAAYQTEIYSPNVGTNSGGRIIADYCDFSNLGNATDNAWHFNANSSGAVFRLSDCTFDNCAGIFQNYNSVAGASVTIERCTWSNSTPTAMGGFGDDFILTLKSQTGATTQIDHNYFDERVLVFNAADAVYEDNIFDNAVYFHDGPLTLFNRNYVRWQDNGQVSPEYGSTLTNNFFIMDFSAWNPHYMGVTGNTGTTTISGNVFWFTTPEAGSEGDGIMIQNPTSGTQAENTITIENNIIMPNGNGPDATNNLSCTLITILFDSAVKQVIMNRNTVFTNGIGGCNLGETQIARAGNVKTCKSNLFIGDSSNAGYKMRDLGHSETDVVLAADADYNASYRCYDGNNYTGNAGKGYHDLVFSGSSDIGLNDIDDIDPQFVDWNRTPLTWDASLGGAGTDMDDASLRMAPGGGSTVQDLLDYIREGFRPQNTMLDNAGFGGVDIGAVDLAGTGDLSPIVDAGDPQTIMLPTSSVSLDGTVTDDGTPTIEWSQFSGPVGVSFDDDSLEDTTAHFPGAGTYVLQLSADDGVNTAVTDTVTITVNAANAVPIVDAGDPQTITLPTDTVNLDGTVTDSDNTPTTEWTQTDGPAGVIFGTSSAIDTTAQFPGAGTYTLQLSADDGVNTAVTDTVTITVNTSTGGSLLVLTGDADCEDTMVRAGTPDTNHDYSGPQVILQSGNDKFLLKFDLSALPAGATINSATLDLTVHNIWTGDNVTVRRCTESWTETGATWNTRDGSTAWTTAGGSSDSTNAVILDVQTADVYSFDVQAIVAEWAGGTANNGFLIDMEDKVAGWSQVGCRESEFTTAADRPVLTIDYTPGTTPPGGGGSDSDSSGCLPGTALPYPAVLFSLAGLLAIYCIYPGQKPSE